MNRISVGYRRTVKKSDDGIKEISHTAGILTTVGIGTMAAFLIACMNGAEETYRPYDTAEAVYTMAYAESGNTSSREELVMPDKSTSADGGESVFEIIGEFFASVIFGES